MSRDVRLIRSPISVAGMVLTTISAVLFLVVFLADLFGLHTNPYVGILVFLVLPALFLLGLILIPLGAWIERRRRAAGKAPTALAWPRIDLNNPTQRTMAVGVFTLTMANIVIVSLASYRGVQYMDSVQFCGQVCHTVMKPEFVAHGVGVHANVKCVDCHVGPGASSFAESKFTGTRRVWAVLTDSYPRPIVATPDQLVSAADSCQSCHWPEEFHGDKLVRVYEYADDAKNTETLTTLQVHVGGGNGTIGRATGIHWHMNIANKIEYIATDKDRQTIPYVKMTDAQGHVTEYLSGDVTQAELAKGERHEMDCMDCHNRPSHAIAATPDRAVNELMASGDIPRTLPFIHRESVKALTMAYTSDADAMRGISSSLRNFYQSQPDPSARRTADLDRAITSVETIYRQNVFPEMNVRFGTYPNNIGHIDSPGCFRCHDDNHKSKDGKTIGQDCDTCHAIE